jgi:hypothetical protein
VIKAESQVVLTPSQKMTFRMHLKNSRSAGNGAYAWKGTTSTVVVVVVVAVASMPKVGF